MQLPVGDLKAIAMALSAAKFSEHCSIIPDPWQRRLLLSDAPRVLVNASRQGGKSQTLATLALHTALYRPQSMILLLSPSLRQSGELFTKCMRLYHQLDRPVPSVRESALQLWLENESRIVSLPGAEGTIRGYSAVDLLIIDEASRVEPELFWSVRPMLAVSNGRLIAGSTPNGMQGWWFDAWVGDEEDWQRFEVPATECPRISPEFLDQERRLLSPLDFQQEYMCQFSATAGAFFDLSAFDRCTQEFTPWNLPSLQSLK